MFHEKIDEEIRQTTRKEACWQHVQYLRSVGVRPRVSHREDTRAGVGQLEVLVGESAAVDRLSAWQVGRIGAGKRKKVKGTSITRCRCGSFVHLDITQQ